MTTTVNLAWVTMAGKPPEFFYVVSTDNAATEIVTFAESQSIGTFQGQTLTGVTVQVSDGSGLTDLELFDAAGGQLLKVRGYERQGTGATPPFNASVDGLSIKIDRGMSLKVTTAD